MTFLTTGKTKGDPLSSVYTPIPILILSGRGSLLNASISPNTGSGGAFLRWLQRELLTALKRKAAIAKEQFSKLLEFTSLFSESPYRIKTGECKSTGRTTNEQRPLLRAVANVTKSRLVPKQIRDFVS